MQGVVALMEDGPLRTSFLGMRRPLGGGLFLEGEAQATGNYRITLGSGR